MNKALPPLKLKAIIRFCRSINLTSSKECWEWLGELSAHKGYGVFWYGSRQYLAHRFAYFLHSGSDPANLLVCHKCDNPKCVNPNHLFIGTHSDNFKDMNKKGRHPRPFSRQKLTHEDVVKIRVLLSEGFSQNKIGKMFGVSGVNIWSIKHNKTWRDI